jgi:hypothetical protein
VIRRMRRVLLWGVLPVAAMLAACSGMELGAVSRGAISTAPAPDAALMVGRIRFMVDGRQMRYGLLDKPVLQLFHRGRGVLMPTPEVESDGRFAWLLPAGDYGVAVIHGGMGPAGEMHRKPNGVLVRVNGFVDPGVEFRLAPGGRHYVGTLEIHVQSVSVREKGVILDFGERVFGRLLEMRVVDERAADASAPGSALTPDLMRVITRPPR